MSSPLFVWEQGPFVKTASCPGPTVVPLTWHFQPAQLPIFTVNVWCSLVQSVWLPHDCLLLTKSSGLERVAQTC